MPKGLQKEESLQVFNLKPYTNFTFTIQAKTIELGERASFTAKTEEGGNFEIFLCLPRCTPFLEAIFFGHGQRPSFIRSSHLLVFMHLPMLSLKVGGGGGGGGGGHPRETD